MKKLLLAGAAIAASMFATSSVSAAPSDCTREPVNLSPAVSAIQHCGHQLAWWGAYFVPGNANGGGSAWSPPAKKEHICDSEEEEE